MRKDHGMIFKFLAVTAVLLLALAGQAFAEAPDTPVLSAPSHGRVVEGETVELQWEAPAGADVYALYVWELTGGVVEVIAENELVFDTSYTLEGLSDDGGVFAWTVAAAATGGESFSDYAIPIAFLNGSDKDVLPPTLTSPEHYSNVPGTEVALEWDAPDGGDTYVVMVWMYTEDEGYVPVVNNEPVHETSYQLEDLNDNGEQYAWTVVAGSTATGEYYGWAFPWIFINGEETVVDELKVVSVEETTATVPWGTEFEELTIPETVVATLDDDSTTTVSVEWEATSTPPYDPETAGDYVWEGDLVDLPDDVINPDDVKALLTVTVEEPVVVEPELEVVSVEAIDRTLIEATLEDDSDEEMAADAENYEVTVGGEEVEVTAVDYDEVTFVASLTVDLDGLSGECVVNGVAADVDVPAVPVFESIETLAGSHEVELHFNTAVFEDEDLVAADFAVTTDGVPNAVEEIGDLGDESFTITLDDPAIGGSITEVRLRTSGAAKVVNIWDEPAAAATVFELTEVDETAPTFDAVTAVLGGDLVTLHFSEPIYTTGPAMDIGADPADHIRITVNGAAVNIQNNQGDVDGDGKIPVIDLADAQDTIEIRLDEDVFEAGDEISVTLASALQTEDGIELRDRSDNLFAGARTRTAAPTAGPSITALNVERAEGESVLQETGQEAFVTFELDEALGEEETVVIEISEVAIDATAANWDLNDADGEEVLGTVAEVTAAVGDQTDDAVPAVLTVTVAAGASLPAGTYYLENAAGITASTDEDEGEVNATRSDTGFVLEAVFALVEREAMTGEFTALANLGNTVSFEWEEGNYDYHVAEDQFVAGAFTSGDVTTAIADDGDNLEVAGVNVSIIWNETSGAFDAAHITNVDGDAETVDLAIDRSQNAANAALALASAINAVVEEADYVGGLRGATIGSDGDAIWITDISNAVDAATANAWQFVVTADGTFAVSQDGNDITTQEGANVEGAVLHVNAGIKINYEVQDQDGNPLDGDHDLVWTVVNDTDEDVVLVSSDIQTVTVAPGETETVEVTLDAANNDDMIIYGAVDDAEGSITVSAMVDGVAATEDSWDIVYNVEEMADEIGLNYPGTELVAYNEPSGAGANDEVLLVEYMGDYFVVDVANPNPQDSRYRLNGASYSEANFFNNLEIGDTLNITTIDDGVGNTRVIFDLIK